NHRAAVDPQGAFTTEATEAPPAQIQPSAAYLLARLRIIETRVRALVAHRRQDDPSPEDPFRGLYLSDEHVDRLLAGGSSPIEAVEGTDDTDDPDGSDLAARREE